MEHSHLPLKEYLVELYKSFEASLRDAFLATVTKETYLPSTSFIRIFDEQCLELSERYFSLINVFVLINNESDAHEELECFSMILKRYIQEDIQNMKRTIKTFVIRASNNVNTKAEILHMFASPGIYKLANLGRLSPRALYV